MSEMSDYVGSGTFKSVMAEHAGVTVGIASLSFKCCFNFRFRRLHLGYQMPGGTILSGQRASASEGKAGDPRAPGQAA